MPTAMIADDEPLLRSQLRARLATLWPELVIASEAGNGLEALAAFDRDADRDPPDLCFLDIHMPGLSGLEVARRIRESARENARETAGRVPHLVFITAFDQHAVEAFEHGAIDYVLKPFDTERLTDTVERLKDRLASGTPSSPASEFDALTLLAARLAKLEPARRATLQWIKASVGSTVRLIPVEDVQYFHADDKYTRVITPDGEALIRKPIKELVAELDPARFWQVHRATIVNVDHIASVKRGLKDQAEISFRDHAETLVVSRAFTPRRTRTMESWIQGVAKDLVDEMIDAHGDALPEGIR